VGQVTTCPTPNTSDMNRTKTLLSLALIAQMSVSFAQKQTLFVGDKAPAIDVVAVKGKKPNLKDGKVHVVEFWATWCGPCRMSIPHLTELAKKYQGKITFTGVSVWERGENTLDQVKQFVKTMGDKMDYNVVADDSGGPMAKNWMTAAARTGIPSAFVVDKSGKIVWMGHPMQMDDILAKVTDGNFDMQQEVQRQKEEQEKAERSKTELQRLLDPYKEALQNRDPKAALVELDKITSAHPEYLEKVAILKFRLLMGQDTKAGFTYAKEMAQGPLKSNSVILLNFVLILLDDANQYKEHDYKLAIGISDQLAKVEKQYAYIAYSLKAQALFKDGNKAAAIAAQEEAVNLAKNNSKVPPQTVEEFEKKLAEYKAAS